VLFPVIIASEALDYEGDARIAADVGGADDTTGIGGKVWQSCTKGMRKIKGRQVVLVDISSTSWQKKRPAEQAGLCVSRLVRQLFGKVRRTALIFGIAASVIPQG
jgi:hypothetical protein